MCDRGSCCARTHMMAMERGRWGEEGQLPSTQTDVAIKVDQVSRSCDRRQGRDRDGDGRRGGGWRISGTFWHGSAERKALKTERGYVERN